MNSGLRYKIAGVFARYAYAYGAEGRYDYKSHVDEVLALIEEDGVGKSKLTAIIEGEIWARQHVLVFRGADYVASAWGIPLIEAGYGEFIVSVVEGELPGATFYVDVLLFAGSMSAVYRILGAEQKDEQRK